MKLVGAGTRHQRAPSICLHVLPSMMFIAGTRQHPYLKFFMIRVLSSLLIALALFISPLLMANGAGMAMPHGAAAAQAQADGHCGSDETPADTKGTSGKASCASACAAVPAASPAPAEAAPATRAVIANGPPQVFSGIHPEGELRPPRITPEI